LTDTTPAQPGTYGLTDNCLLERAPPAGLEARRAGDSSQLYIAVRISAPTISRRGTYPRDCFCRGQRTNRRRPALGDATFKQRGILERPLGRLGRARREASSLVARFLFIARPVRRRGQLRHAITTPAASPCGGRRTEIARTEWKDGRTAECGMKRRKKERLAFGERDGTTVIKWSQSGSRVHDLHGRIDLQLPGRVFDHQLRRTIIIIRIPAAAFRLTDVHGDSGEGLLTPRNIGARLYYFGPEKNHIGRT